MVAKIPADDAAAATAQNYFLERTKVFFPWERESLASRSCDKRNGRGVSASDQR